MKKYKAPVSFFSALTALVLECLPYGVTLWFQSPEETLWQSHAFFSLLPYGYGVVGPFFSFVLSVLVVLFAAWAWWKPSQRRCVIQRILSLAAAILALSPVLFGLRYLTVIGVMVAVLLGISTVFCPKEK